ncbi:MAG: DUF2848 domain-containing protein [Desulfuromusa sp.]
MSNKNLQLVVDGRIEEIAIDRLVIAGWVGRDREALQKHIDELGELGIEAPGQTPTYMNLSPETLTSGKTLTVVGADSSGEVECVVITRQDGRRYLSVGSDHTDREFEKYSIPASKQMCGKPLATEAWPLADILDHMGSLIMRSWMIKNGNRTLYQEGTLNMNRDVKELLAGIPEGCVAAGESFCLFCGTFAAIGGLAYGDRFEFEIYDPVLKRNITHGYDIQVLPQFL